MIYKACIKLNEDLKISVNVTVLSRVNVYLIFSLLVGLFFKHFRTKFSYKIGVILGYDLAQYLFIKGEF